jgi:hypothetical protein
MRPHFKRVYRWVRALLVGFLVGVWLLPTTTPTGLLTTRNGFLNEVASSS